MEKTFKPSPGPNAELIKAFNREAENRVMLAFLGGLRDVDTIAAAQKLEPQMVKDAIERINKDAIAETAKVAIIL